MAGAGFPCSGIVSLPDAARGKWGRHAHGWSAPHGPTLCGLRPTSDISHLQWLSAGALTAHILRAIFTATILSSGTRLELFTIQCLDQGGTQQIWLPKYQNFQFFQQRMLQNSSIS